MNHQQFGVGLGLFGFVGFLWWSVAEQENEIPSVPREIQKIIESVYSPDHDSNLVRYMILTAPTGTLDNTLLTTGDVRRVLRGEEVWVVQPPLYSEVLRLTEKDPMLTPEAQNEADSELGYFIPWEPVDGRVFATSGSRQEVWFKAEKPLLHVLLDAAQAFSKDEYWKLEGLS